MKKKAKVYKSLFYVFLFLAVLFFIGNLYFFILLYTQCTAAEGVFLAPARVPYFLIVFFAGFFILCFAGWYIAFRYSY